MAGRSPKAAMHTICWPDIKPSKASQLLGTKRAMLTYIQPVYAALYRVSPTALRPMRTTTHWYWLMACDCGNEIILSQAAKQGSCGCEVAKASHTMPRESGSIRRFNRLKTCTRGDYSCIHYRECQDERIETNDLSTRYKTTMNGSCYEACAQERKLLGGSGEITGLTADQLNSLRG